VRYSPGSQPVDNVVKLDIDLCDEHGNVCAQVSGFSSRLLSREIRTTSAGRSLVATPIRRAGDGEPVAEAGKVGYTAHHVILCELSKVTAETLKSFLRQSQCCALQAAKHKSIAERYREYAATCFEHIQAILRGEPRGKVLIQIVIAAHQEQYVFAGL